MRKVNQNILVAVCALIMTLAGPGADGATIFFVPGDYPTIQTAINAADPSDEIEVAPGTYNEAIYFNGKAVKVYSSDGPNVTTIDATGLASSVVTCNNGEDANTILEGFTITGGYANGSYPDDCGGGMYNCNASPVVTNCIFTENIADVNGGGMYNKGSNPKITNCIFSGNLAGYGGGIYDFNSSPKITNCTFTGNTADANGGGIYNNGSSPTIINCILWGNVAPTPNGSQVSNDNNSSPVISYSDIQGGWSPPPWDPNTDLLFNMNFEVYDNNLHTTNTAKPAPPSALVGTVFDYNSNEPNVFGELSAAGLGHDANFGDMHDNAPGSAIQSSVEQDTDAHLDTSSWIPIFDLGGDGEMTVQHTWTFWFNVPKLEGTILRHTSIHYPDSGYDTLMWEIRITAPGVLEFYHDNNSLKMETASTLAELGVTINTWHHAAVVIDRSNVVETGIPTTQLSSKIYVDGLEVPIIVSSVNTYSMNVDTDPLTPAPIWIGAGEREFDGLLDEVRLYKEALTPSQVSILSGAYNINADPCFVNLSEGNYRLLPNSPCIDAGDNDSVPADTADLDGDGNTVEPIPYDLDGQPRFVDGDCSETAVVDMGAFEFNYAYMGDFDYNCTVNFRDFAIFAMAWLTEPPEPMWNRLCDIGIPPDGIIDELDLKIITDNWLISAE